MKSQNKTTLLLALFVVSLFQISPAFAVASDDQIKQSIKQQFTENKQLQDIKIKVQVENRLVVLTGQVRLYEQKLVASRIAWSAQDVFEINNEIRVVPKVALADSAIERKVREIIKNFPVFKGLDVDIKVEDGVVSVSGSFPQISGPTFLRHKVAEIEGVIYIDIKASFLAIKQPVNLKQKGS